MSNCFPFQGAPGDIVQLHRALTQRIAVSKQPSTCAQNTNSQKAAERLEAATSETEFLDKPVDDVCSTTDDVDGGGDKNVDDEDKTDYINDESRLQDTKQKTDGKETSVDTETKALKRKDPVEDETTPKRQCPEILIE